MNETSTSSPRLDAVDRRLLNLLQEDAWVTNQTLAERAHLSAPTCLRRVRRLMEAGVIERTIAIVAPEKVAPMLTAIVEVTLERQGAEHLDAFEALIRDEPAVQQCYRVSPGPDFVLIVVVPDMPAYHALMHRLFTAQANVRNVRSFFAVKRSKFAPRVPLPQ
ncbi:MAG: Lrp/AsnC family transcriptional regulator [Sutterellaceae bacterium]|nr:Lrp/AsnC family transcriptional regulator [Burkholderiaceae bacterium]MDW8429708.1 Lrp/AsnC family transcriptional regulator [Sutterellaceae bacterium]